MAVPVRERQRSRRAELARQGLKEISVVVPCKQEAAVRAQMKALEQRHKQQQAGGDDAGA